MKVLGEMRRKWLAVTVALAGYFLAFQILYPSAGAPVASLSFFPVLVGAYLYSRWGGYLIVAITSGLNGYLFAVAEGASEEASSVTMAIVPTLTLLVTAEIMARLRNANLRLVDVIHSKDHFLASVSHELRTPLTGVLGFAEVLTESWPQTSDDEKLSLVNEINNGAKEAAGIIDDLLVASRAELDQLLILCQPVDVAAEIKRVLGALPRIAGRNIDFKGEPGVMALADAGRLRQIIRNLLTNAIRYGGPTIWIDAEEARDAVVIQVADTGDGLPPSEWQKIFEPYHQAHIESSKPSGVGVGLSVSRLLAELMGGEISYQHRGGVSLFELTIPRYVST